MKVITIANQKGGVGKTTSAAAFAVLLAQQGKRALVVDLDQQANLTTLLRVDPRNATGDVLDPGRGREVADVVQRSEYGMDVLAASQDMETLDLALALAPAGQVRLRDALAAVADRYDAVVIDCPPNVGLLTINALVAADLVVAPVKASDINSVTGLARLRTTAERSGPLRADRAAPPILPLLTIYNPKKVADGEIEITVEEGLRVPIVGRIVGTTKVERDANKRIPHVARRPDSAVAEGYRGVLSAIMGESA